MTLRRTVGVLLIFGAIALGVVWLRTEEVRTAQRIQHTQLELVRIRRELWSLQIAIAQYKAPQRISEEVIAQDLELAGPTPPPREKAPETRWAKAR